MQKNNIFRKKMCERPCALHVAKNHTRGKNPIVPHPTEKQSGHADDLLHKLEHFGAGIHLQRARVQDDVGTIFEALLLGTE